MGSRSLTRTPQRQERNRPKPAVEVVEAAKMEEVVPQKEKTTKEKVPREACEDLNDFKPKLPDDEAFSTTQRTALEEHQRACNEKEREFKEKQRAVKEEMEQSALQF